MPIKLPKSLLMLGRKIKIEVVDGLPDDEFGTFETNDGIGGTIKISSRCSPEALTSTLLHEMIHAALQISGVSEMLHDKAEEAVVVAIENGLHAHITFKIKQRRTRK